MPLFLREKSSLKGRWRLETVQDMRSSSSNPVSCSETSIKIYGSKEEIRARKSPETVDAPGFAPDASIPITLYGAVGGIRTLVPLLTTTRFPVVLVMTSSIPLHIQFPLTDSVDHYTKISTDVKTFFCSSAAIIHNVITRRRRHKKHRKSFKLRFSPRSARERLHREM